jgi:low temperature requirement protein LtrA
MLASMLGAAASPDAFGEGAMLLVFGYVGMQSVRNAFLVLATDPDDPLHLPVVQIFAWNLWFGAIWFAGTLAGHEARTAIWIVALVCDYAGPVLGHWTPRRGRSAPRDWDLEPAHFAERLMLFVIIALGETIVAACSGSPRWSSRSGWRSCCGGCTSTSTPSIYCVISRRLPESAVGRRVISRRSRRPDSATRLRPPRFAA